ncbi:hypothetical protein Sp14A_17140 [Streptococcus pluranimalium]|uniref:Uncharacterized protein n=1 Tax=Streptococcus pluranimalium TaxID=82348 RepID=A0A345VLL9_9STRE|nr:hypothetical protein Sp14A_17140 [Streptococcus pluranimalium]
MSHFMVAVLKSNSFFKKGSFPLAFSLNIKDFDDFSRKK